MKQMNLLQEASYKIIHKLEWTMYSSSCLGAVEGVLNMDHAPAAVQLLHNTAAECWRVRCCMVLQCPVSW